MQSLSDDLSEKDGALVRIRVELVAEDLRRRRTKQTAIPQPVECTALIDTGASVTCFDSAVLKKLSLIAKSLRMVHAPGLSGTHPAGFYEIRLVVMHPNQDPFWSLEIPVLEIAELDLGVSNFEALLGRDFLSHCTFQYDGLNDTYTLTHSP
jgi:hypothetical protein